MYRPHCAPSWSSPSRDHASRLVGTYIITASTSGAAATPARRSTRGAALVVVAADLGDSVEVEVVAAAVGLSEEEAGEDELLAVLVVPPW
jgi:hypothetical protein